jgi:type IV pilus biogenesis protein CpaD/CtpE
MRKIVLAPIALAFLAACATHDKVTSAPAPVVIAPAQAPVVVQQQPAGGTVVVQQQPAIVVVPASAQPLRAGSGRIESIMPGPAAAGGSAQASKRVGVRMADGTNQDLDTTATGMGVGDSVEIGTDGYMTRP